VSRGIFGSEREEVKGDWRRLHNEELHNLSSLADVVCIIESRNMDWAGHVALMKEMKMHEHYLQGNLKEQDPLEDLTIDEMITLRLILKKWRE
jgi:hypothetical protein